MKHFLLLWFHIEEQKVGSYRYENHIFRNLVSPGKDFLSEHARYLSEDFREIVGFSVHGERFTPSKIDRTYNARYRPRASGVYGKSHREKRGLDLSQELNFQ